jgi:hypothetical protein
LRLGDVPSGQNHLETFFGKALGGRETHSRARSDAEKCLHLLFLSTLHLKSVMRSLPKPSTPFDDIVASPSQPLSRSCHQRLPSHGLAFATR